MDLLFDLDGTLTDPAVGITTCIQHALSPLDQSGIPPRAALTRYIGPPLGGSFAELLGTDDPERIKAAVTAYRDRFSSMGLYENEVYPDIPVGLRELRDAGHRLWVATSKPRLSDLVLWRTRFFLKKGSAGSSLRRTELVSPQYCLRGLWARSRQCISVIRQGDASSVLQLDSNLVAIHDDPVSQAIFWR